MDSKLFRHKHLFTFNNFWDANKDGVLSWDDFAKLAENFTKIQRKGKVEKEVLERWLTLFKKWWTQLTFFADYNADKFVEFDEWLKFFDNLGQTTKSYQDLPDFLKTYLHLLFLCMDTNKDGLFCLKDYKKYLSSQKYDTSRAEECFKYMLSEEDERNANAFTSERFKSLVYDFWFSKEENSKGKYICGPFDSTSIEDLEKKIKKL